MATEFASQMKDEYSYPGRPLPQKLFIAVIKTEPL
jgi:hypothetical protein